MLHNKNPQVCSWQPPCCHSRAAVTRTPQKPQRYAWFGPSPCIRVFMLPVQSPNMQISCSCYTAPQGEHWICIMIRHKLVVDACAIHHVLFLFRKRAQPQTFMHNIVTAQELTQRARSTKVNHTYDTNSLCTYRHKIDTLSPSHVSLHDAGEAWLLRRPREVHTCLITVNIQSLISALYRTAAGFSPGVAALLISQHEAAWGIASKAECSGTSHCSSGDAAGPPFQ